MRLSTVVVIMWTSNVSDLSVKTKKNSIFLTCAVKKEFTVTYLT